MKITASSPITSWQIDGGKVETVADFIFLGSQITADGDCSHEIRRHMLLGRKDGWIVLRYCLRSFHGLTEFYSHLFWLQHYSIVYWPYLGLIFFWAHFLDFSIIWSPKFFHILGFVMEAAHFQVLTVFVNYCHVSSVQFSSVVSDSLRPHESQHARPPSPSPTPGVHSDSRPSSW